MRALAALCLLLLARTAGAQTTSALLGELNALYDGAVRFRIDKADRLVIDHFDASGHFRQDVAYVEFLAPERTAYTVEEGAVLVGCAADHAHCIDKEVFRMRTVRRTDRSNLSTAPGDADGARATALLTALLTEGRAAIARKADETRARPQRKK